MRNLLLGPMKNKIISVLGNVEDWETLARQLSVKESEINSIRETCNMYITPASCYRMKLVSRLCLSRESPEKAISDLIQALKEIGLAGLVTRLVNILPQSGKLLIIL